MSDPDDDFLIAMGLESAWVTPAAAEALCDEGLCEYGLHQDQESMQIYDGLVLCTGVVPDDVWEWLRENGSGHNPDLRSGE